MPLDAPLDSLTSKEYWDDYWKGHTSEDLFHNVFFEELLDFFPSSQDVNKGTQPGLSFVELGGYPGNYAAFFKRRFNYDVTLVDQHILPDVIRRVEKKAGLAPQTIHALQMNLQTELPESAVFDIVFSAGFLEHFQQTDLMFAKHVQFLKSKGLLFISVPNFKGVYGWAQWLFDRENYKVHHIECMQVSVFRDLAAQNNLDILYLDYVGVPHVWLESSSPAGRWTRRGVRLFSSLLQRLGSRFKSRWLSPHLVLIARKK